MDLMNEEVIAVLPLTNTMALMIAILEDDEDYIYYQWSDEDESVREEILYTDDGQPYFQVNDEMFLISEFVKIDRRDFSLNF